MNNLAGLKYAIEGYIMNPRRYSGLEYAASQ